MTHRVPRAVCRSAREDYQRVSAVVAAMPVEAARGATRRSVRLGAASNLSRNEQPRFSTVAAEQPPAPVYTPFGNEVSEALPRVIDSIVPTSSHVGECKRC